MSRVAAFLVLTLVTLSALAAEDPALLMGHWTGGFDHDFVIGDGTISFPPDQCDSKFDVVESFDSEIVEWTGERKRYISFVLRIEYADVGACVSVAGFIGKYIRMSLNKDDHRYSDTFFYQDDTVLEKDRSDHWSRNFTSGWSLYTKEETQ